MRSRKISSVLLECLSVSDSPGDLVKNANCCFVFVFLGPHPQHMEVPRPWVQSELQLLAYTTATATWDLSHVCNLHHSSRQLQILNTLLEARDRTRVPMDAGRVR